MLLRFTLSAAGAMVLAGTAAAQQGLQPKPITAPVKDAGVYHVATGTWTRGVSAVALAGPEVIYDNTCTVGFYVGLPQGSDNADSGRIPSTNSPSTATSLTGLYDDYEVNGFTLAYCTFEPLVTSLGVGFYDCYNACDNAGAGYPTPTAAFNLVNVPGGTATGSQGCWIITFDLANTTLAFNLGGDCDGVYDNVASTDSFGWSWTQSIPTTGSAAGPLLAGDPLGLFNASCGGVGGGTTFVGAAAGPGSGIGNPDQFEAAGSLVGCFWFGGYSAANPYSSFYLQLQGDQGNATASNTGNAYCFGDGTGATCPCVAFGQPGEGCLNTTGTNGAKMTASGNAYLSADTFQLDIVGVPGNKPGLLLRGINQIGNPVGDGILCTAGQSARSQVQVTNAGATTFTTFQLQPFGATAFPGGQATNYQFWYRDPSNTCSGAGFNFSNGWTVTYLP
jgi:hypothetical protein